MKTAFVTGWSGQDGTFLTRFLLDKGYKVVGLVRRISTEPPRRVRGKFDFKEELKSGKLILESGDLNSISSLLRIIKKHRPHEVYNLAAQSHVGVSFEQPEYTMSVNYEGLLNLMTALDFFAPDARLYQASTSEMFGDRVNIDPIDEGTPFNPTSPYAISKAAAHYAIQQRRRAGKYAVGGILFNHESEIRGGDFVTQKIVRSLVHFEMLELGNLDSARDWGFAGDYVEAMWLMLQQKEPQDFVIGTGEVHSVRQFVEAVLRESYSSENHAIGVIEWRGKGKGEVGVLNGKVIVRVNPAFYRPTDVNFLVAFPLKAKDVLKWQSKTSFQQLVKRMVEAESKND